jgi:hypothetical protein
MGKRGEAVNLDKEMLDVLNIIRNYERTSAENITGKEIDYIVDEKGSKKAREIYDRLEAEGLVTFPFEDRNSAKTTPKGRTVCEECGWVMTESGTPCFELQQVGELGIGPKRQRQYKYFCTNPDCPKPKEEPTLVLEDIE